MSWKGLKQAAKEGWNTKPDPKSISFRGGFWLGQVLAAGVIIWAIATAMHIVK